MIRNHPPLALKNHSKYEIAIQEILLEKVDEKLMKVAIQNTDTHSQAEALYIKYRLLGFNS